MAFLTGKDAKVLVKATDLNLTLREYNPESSADEVDTTVFEDTGRKFIAGFTEGSHELVGFFERGTANSDELFHDLLDDTAAFAVTFVPQGLTSGNRAMLLKAVSTGYRIGSSVGDAVAAACSLVGAGGAKWGQLIQAAAITATTNGTGYDNPSDAATTKGARFHLHVTANDRNAGTLDVKIQDSADNSSFADVTGMAFTQVAAGATTSEVKDYANGSTLRRYVRAVSTVTGGASGSYTVRVAYQRNF